MSARNDETQVLSLGEVAAHFGCKTWQIRRLFERKLMAEPPRFGMFRMLRRSQLGEVEAALKKGGYLPVLVESK